MKFKVDFKAGIKVIQRELVKHGPDLLFAGGIATMGMAVGSGIKATPKVLMAIELEEKQKFQETGKRVHLTKKEKFKVAWKYYVPTAIEFAVGTGCLVGSRHLNIKRTASFATAYTVTKEAYDAYKESTKEVVGEKKEQTIRETAAEKKVHDHPITECDIGSDPVVTAQGKCLCFETSFNKYFYSTYNDIIAAQNNFNELLNQERYMSLNEWYDILGLNRVNGGEAVGWNVDDGLLDISISSCIADDGRPCLCVDYLVYPKGDYKDTY